MIEQQQFPKVSSPVVDVRTGNITQTWYQFLIALWTRTGASQGNSTFVSGDVKCFAGDVSRGVQSGWLLCDGSAISRTAYSSLFNVIGTLWGSGDGLTTFNLPDFRGRFLLDANTSYLIGTRGGSYTQTLVVDNLPAHNHGITDPGHTHVVTDPGHTHVVTDPGHTHVVTDPGHTHAVNDSGHVHTITDPGHMHTTGAAASNGTAGAAAVGTTAGSTGSNTTGITVNSGTTGVTNQSNTTGVTNNTNVTGVTNNTNVTGVTNNVNVTGVTTNNTGSNQAFSIVPPYATVNYIIKI